MSEDEKLVKVTCPVCSFNQSIGVPMKIVKENVKGVTTIAIKAQCDHSFQIFVDKNFSVRGYQRSDYDIKLDAPTVEKDSKVMDLSFPGILHMFGEDAFLHAMRAMLLGTKVILVGSDQQILKSLFINFIGLFERELTSEADALVIMSKEEFKSISPFELTNELVIDIDFSTIKNNPFKDVKVKYERELLKEVLGKSDVEHHKEDFKKMISNIFLYASVILNFVNMGQKSFKEIKKTMKAKDKDISMRELSLAWDITEFRYSKELTG